MPEHDCGGWCTRTEGRAAALSLLRAGKKCTEVARETGQIVATVSNWAGEARRRGCLPEGRRRGTAREKACGNPECGDTFIAYHGGTKCCGPVCARRARQLGVTFKEKDDPRDLGPEEPPIRVDEVGQRRRALEAATDGVSEDDMLSRFPHAVVTWAIIRAKEAGYRSDMRTHLDNLPLGLPA